ncbi:MAG: NUDIX hydrolase [Sulfurisoma sp.]|nr:NUDIX hydrolase [Sulfurisoma sp.]
MARRDNPSLAHALEVAGRHLPLHAEEGTLREALAEGDLIAAFVKAGLNADAAVLLVALLRRQFEALALLDRVELAAGRWAFVSFPAALLGHSLLESLATPGQTMLPPEYWEQGDHRPAEVKEEQRRLLHRIESERLRQNPAARPVRVVHVAWAVIRLGQRFLLHHREDRDRPGEKSHVLPGGRLNPGDLPAAVLAQGLGLLRQLAVVDSPLADVHLDTTLIRELTEELGLRHGADYQFARWQRLPPFRQVAGAGNRHAYTEYAFQLYTLRLTPAGEVHLLEREAETDTLAWFSAEELSAPRRADGTSAYVDALHAAWGADVARQLESVPDSAATTWAITGETRMIDLPAALGVPIVQGKTGKEKPVSPTIAEAEWQLLTLLGWHARGFAIRAGDSLRLLGGGWARLADDQAQKAAHALFATLQGTDLPLLEMRDAHYLRLSIEPGLVMFGPELFAYALDDAGSDGGMLRLERNSVATPWGDLSGETLAKPIKRNTLLILQALERCEYPESVSGVNAASWEKNLRDQILPAVQQIGLRKLWVTESKSVTLAAGVRRLR